MTTSDQEPRPGARFADFTIDGVLGRGGMGVVYRAKQERLNRLVALKVIAPHLAHDTAFRGRFSREASMAAAIDHPSILPIYEAGEFEGQPFLVMRHVRGTDLKTLIERTGRLDPRRAVGICDDIAGALDAAHGRGLVHRDVKPANILIGQEHDQEVVYLTDFGLTKGRGDARLTQTGKWVGTVDYMAPEQIEGKDVDGRADQYALACVLVESLTGGVPFRRESDVQIMWAHIRDDPPLPSAMRPELGPAIDAVIAQAMTKHPQARYASCREFARAAGAAVDKSQSARMGSVTPPADRAAPTRAAVGDTVTGDLPAPPPPRGRSRTPLLVGAAVVGVLAVAAVAAVALDGGGGKRETTVVAAASAPAGTTQAPLPSSGSAETAAPVISDAGVATTALLEGTVATGPPPSDTAADTGAFPPTSAAGVIQLAQGSVPFLALYDLIQGGTAGTLLLAFDGDARIAYRVRLPRQATIWAAFEANAIQYGCVQTSELPEPVCTDGTDREEDYRSLIREFVDGLFTAEAVVTNFGELAAQDPPVLTGQMAGAPVACIQSVGAGTARLCVREDSIITEVTVIEEGQEIGARARRAGPTVTENDFSPPAPIQ